jgi:hypothetical protein
MSKSPNTFESHRTGEFDQLLGIRDVLIEDAANEVETAARAMDLNAILEITITDNLQVPTGPELLQTVDPATFVAASATAPKPQYNGAQAPIVSQAPETGQYNMLTEVPRPEDNYIDRLAAEEMVARSYDAGSELGNGNA